MMIIPSFSDSVRPAPLTQGAAPSAKTGESRPRFCCFSCLDIGLTAMGAGESASRTLLLLGMQPI